LFQSLHSLRFPSVEPRIYDPRDVIMNALIEVGVEIFMVSHLRDRQYRHPQTFEHAGLHPLDYVALQTQLSTLKGGMADAERRLNRVFFDPSFSILVSLYKNSLRPFYLPPQPHPVVPNHQLYDPGDYPQRRAYYRTPVPPASFTLGFPSSPQSCNDKSVWNRLKAPHDSDSFFACVFTYLASFVSRYYFEIVSELHLHISSDPDLAGDPVKVLWCLIDRPRIVFDGDCFFHSFSCTILRRHIHYKIQLQTKIAYDDVLAVRDCLSTIMIDLVRVIT